LRRRSPSGLGVAPPFSSAAVLAAIPGISEAESADLLDDRGRSGAGRGAVMEKYRGFVSPVRPIFTLRVKVMSPPLPTLKRSFQFALSTLPLRYRGELAVIKWMDEVWE